MNHPEKAFLVSLVYHNLNKSYPNLKTTRVGAEFDFYSFDTTLDSLASKLKECIAGTCTHTD